MGSALRLGQHSAGHTRIRWLIIRQILNHLALAAQVGLAGGEADAGLADIAGDSGRGVGAAERGLLGEQGGQGGAVDGKALLELLDVLGGRHRLRRQLPDMQYTRLRQ